MLLVVRTFVHYPKHVINSQWLSQQPLEGDASDGTNPLTAIVDNFANRCRQELPPDARILFHGAQEAWIFAYEVYPRKVFMLPSEGFQLAKTFQSRPWSKALPKDPLEAYWNRELPSPLGEREAFIRAHHITHEVYFQVDHPMQSRWETVR